MDKITESLELHYQNTFDEYGATHQGVNWGEDLDSVKLRYDKMLDVLNNDFPPVFTTLPSLLDIGCGWGGLYERSQERKLKLDYCGIDVVDDMIIEAKKIFPHTPFFHQDIFSMPTENQYDFVVCNGIMMQKLAASNPEMEQFSKKLIKKMFELTKHGMVFNMMSTKVNFMVDNLFYNNPVEMFSWLLSEVSSRVKIDHGYNTLNRKDKVLFDYTVYVYKD